MATTTVKSTYALDVGTVRALEEMARECGVSKSEILRRAIGAARRGAVSGTPKPLAALDALQRSLELERPAAASWERKARGERRSASSRREPR